MTLIDEAKMLYEDDNNLEVDIPNKIFAIDAIIIDFPLSSFYWAKYKHTRGGIKVHTQLD